MLSLLAHAGSIDKFLESGHDRPLLTPGQTLGRYTVAELIGRGGMGEVYRARDSRPPRDIAIKILPPEFAADPERLLRFEREARAAGTLNHPNIVTIHSVEESGDLRFLTMELVDGQPLSRVIPASGFVLERLLDIAVQLADAVGTAHLGGIVHRDLKPANVMITREGRVKVLDLGLAKLRPLAVAPDLTTTAPGSLSEVGQLLGTIAYMSPEQAEGREVDHRSDVFSLGVVLYELATGNRPFTGDSSVSLLSSILKDTPRPVDDVRPSLPPEFGRIVRRCLMKEPARRYHSAIDVRNQLEELRQDVAAGAAAVRSIAKQGWLPGHDATRKRPRVLRWLAWTGAGVGALAVIALVYLGSRGTLELGWLSRREADGAIVGPVRKTISIPESVTVIQALAISPDGTKLAFTGSGRLWLYDLASEETRH